MACARADVRACAAAWRTVEWNALRASVPVARVPGRRGTSGVSLRRRGPPCRAKGKATMDLIHKTTPRLEELRAEVRGFIEEEYPPEYAGFQWDFEEDPDRWAFMYEFWKKLGARGLIWPTWPEEWGGRAMSARQAAIVHEEFARYRVGEYGGIGASVGPSIIKHGTPEQREFFLPRMARGEIMWAEGYTEPNSGSDLASLRTRADNDGDEWVINGQKTFCTAGHWCNWMIIFARTDPDHSKRHKGISAFLAPMENEPAIQLTPLYNIADGRQNIVYFDNLRVPDHLMLGDVNQAWFQLWFGLGGDPLPTFEDDDPGPETEYEPPLTGQAWVLDQLIRYCQETLRGGQRMIDDPLVRDQLAELAIGVETEKVLRWEGFGCEYGSHLHSAISKEFQPEFGQICMEILGPLGIIQRGQWAPLAGEIDRVYRRSFGNHAGGTSQLKRMVVATRALGLAR
jgi:alkylation response protein AidB-like acyl-CoA dehydrogenase